MTCVPLSGTTHTITGTVNLTYRDETGQPNAPGDPPGRICLCCGPEFPGHVFGIGFALPPYLTQFPDHFGRRLDYWLQDVLPFKALEGRRIKVTVELLPGEATTGQNPRPGKH
jgi:hypothetical protein